MELTKLVARKFSFFKNIPILPIIIDEQIKVFTLFAKPDVFSKMTELVKKLKSFSDVKSRYHRYGGLEFRVAGKEFCHIHGDGLVDVLLNHEIASLLIDRDLCMEHHVQAESGWVSYQINSETDVDSIYLICTGAFQLRKREDVTETLRQLIPNEE